VQLNLLHTFGNLMKKLLIAAAVSALGATGAHAADMAAPFRPITRTSAIWTSMSFASARTIASDFSSIESLNQSPARTLKVLPGFLFAVIYPITRTGLPSIHAAMSSTMSP
jgi:hypothetical protein